jgi:hypothetical protein
MGITQGNLKPTSNFFNRIALEHAFVSAIYSNSMFDKATNIYYPNSSFLQQAWNNIMMLIFLYQYLQPSQHLNFLSIHLFPSIWCIVSQFVFLFPQANGHTYVDFGCTHPIDGLFWSLLIYLLGFFSKYEDLIMPLYHFIFLGCHLLFCITRFLIIMKCKKEFIWLIF